MKRLDTHQILTDQQHGFRKKRSCESQLILTVQDLASATRENEQIDAIYLNFSKAFDKISHQRLAIKLHHNEIRLHLLVDKKNFFTNRWQQVTVEGQTSNPVLVTSGVPQGTVLRPLLFLIYKNDLPLKVHQLPACTSMIACCMVESGAQKMLGYCRRISTDFKPGKNNGRCRLIQQSVIMKIKKINPIRTTYQIHSDHDLTVTKAGFKYLGITISNNLSWNAHVNATVKKANNSLAFLRRNLARCPKDVEAQVYQTMVRPILEYASTSWDRYTVTNIHLLGAVLRRVARFVRGEYKTSTSPSQMIAELGWNLCTQEEPAPSRITYGLIDIPAPDFLHPSTLSTRGNTLRYIYPTAGRISTDIHSSHLLSD